MEGLEDTAEASMNDLVDQLRSKDRVEIRHSSRTTVMLRVCEELKAPTTTVKSLVFRSGTSISDLERLADALRFNDTLEALTFVCLTTTQEIRAAIGCCRHSPHLKSLSLMNYTPSISRREGEGREMIAATICEAVFGTPVDQLHGSRYEGGVPNISVFEIDNYPLGSQGIQILEEPIASSKSLTVLRLTSCDLRSDSARSVAEIIKRNRHLRVLDLSHNRLFLGDGIKREMTLNDLVKRGLRFNTSLLELELQTIPNFGKIELQLRINRFRVACLEANRDPFSVPPKIWAEILGKVAPKPSVLYETLRYGAMVLFR